jgi:hypothetical protein
MLRYFGIALRCPNLKIKTKNQAMKLKNPFKKEKAGVSKITAIDKKAMNTVTGGAGAANTATTPTSKSAVDDWTAK